MNTLPTSTAAALLAATCAIAAPHPAQAAYLSELFFDDGIGETGMPGAVELTDLDRVAADAVDLIVIDAAEHRFGLVYQVIRVPTDEPLLLISDREWPADLWGSWTKLGDARTTLDDLGEPDPFSFAGARSVLLFDGPTRVEADGLQNLFSSTQQARLDGAELLDALSFTFAPLVDDEAFAPVATVSPGMAIVRPTTGDDVPADAIYWGEVDEMGRLRGLSPPLEVTPGLHNPVWHPIPEPGSATLVLASLAVLLIRRRPRADRRAYYSVRPRSVA